MLQSCLTYRPVTREKARYKVFSKDLDKHFMLKDYNNILGLYKILIKIWLKTFFQLYNTQYVETVYIFFIFLVVHISYKNTLSQYRSIYFIVCLINSTIHVKFEIKSRNIVRLVK